MCLRFSPSRAYGAPVARHRARGPQRFVLFPVPSSPAWRCGGTATGGPRYFVSFVRCGLRRGQFAASIRDGRRRFTRVIANSTTRFPRRRTYALATSPYVQTGIEPPLAQPLSCLARRGACSSICVAAQDSSACGRDHDPALRLRRVATYVVGHFVSSPRRERYFEARMLGKSA